MDIDKLLKELGIEEKIRLIVGAGFFTTKIPGVAGETRAIDRLGIPSIALSDGPAGIRIHPIRFGDKSTYYTTAFPNEIALASTWNPEIVEKVGKAIGAEAREYGIDVLLAPGINIHRVPLCGRNFEYFSEDPLLTAILAASYVKGVQSEGVGATLKHFIANEQETGRMSIDVMVSERALREIYLRAFEIAIELSKPWAVMAAYNKIYGKYCTQNSWLLTNVLREDWRYNGLVMTDWWAGDNPVEQIKAGIDLIMPGDDRVVQILLEAYRKGELDEETIDARARRVLELISKSLKWKGYKPSNNPNLEENAKIAYEAAVDGAILLKNNGALPISQEKTVAVFGKGSYLTIKGGLGSGNTYPRYVVSIVDGLKERGIKINNELDKIYRETMVPLWFDQDAVTWYRNMREYVFKEGDTRLISWLVIEFTESILSRLMALTISEDFIDEETLDRIAKESDIALITISRISSEGYDRKAVKGDFYLRDDEYRLIQKVSEKFHSYNKKVVVILNIPSPIEIISWRDLVDAILVIWLSGQEIGRAVADIILGRVSPSGKLPITWPKHLSEIPAIKTFPGEPKENPKRIVYEEGIYVGYRYYDTFGIEPAYEFGYGLSYTLFEFRDLRVYMDDDTIVAKLRIKNIGNAIGKEVAQLYVRAPRGKIDKPYQELKGFYKTKPLKPGEEEEVEIKVPIKYLASYDGNKWVIERGEYEIRVGASSRDIRLRTSITIEKDVCFDKHWYRVEC
ncbi:MAG: beta-glucosidase [Ignisphaera sp.]